VDLELRDTGKRLGVEQQEHASDAVGEGVEFVGQQDPEPVEPLA
jgi:hypothetical protein